MGEMFKKLINYILVVSLIVCGFSGCGKSNTNNTSEDKFYNIESQCSEEEDSESMQTSTSQEILSSEIETQEQVSSEIETQEPMFSETESTITDADSMQESEEPTESEKIQPEYTYTDLNKVMYAISRVNVRDIPSSEGGKKGSLKKGEMVVVTGQCVENNWYRIQFDDFVGYVSNKYLSDSEPDRNSETSEIPETSETPDTESDKLSKGEQMAKEIVDEIISTSMSDLEKAVAIHDWITYHIDYDFTYSHFYLEETLRDRTGVCQGYALTFQAMCEIAGLEVDYVTGEANNGVQIGGHAWNRVKIDGVWYNVDVTWDDPAYNGKDPNYHFMNNYDHFLVSDETLYVDHYTSNVKYVCANDYSRISIVKTAIQSGNLEEVAFIETIEDLDVAVEKYMNAEKTQFKAWIYDPDMTDENVEATIQNLVSQSKYSTYGGYDTVKEGLTNTVLVITPMSEWNKYPVATNKEEYLDIVELYLEQGITSFKIRYETEDGNFDIEVPGYTYKSLDWSTYHNNLSKLIEITLTKMP